MTKIENSAGPEDYSGFPDVHSATFARDLSLVHSIVVSNELRADRDLKTSATVKASLMVSRVGIAMNSPDAYGQVPTLLIDTARELALRLLADVDLVDYGSQCVLGLHEIADPVSAYSRNPFEFTLGGELHQVWPYEAEGGSDVAAWMLSPAGWFYALRPFDVRQDEDRRRAAEGHVDWRPVHCGPRPYFGTFVDHALAIVTASTTVTANPSAVQA